MKNQQHRKDFIAVSTTLVVFLVAGVWIMQGSINAYYQQTYHKSSPLTSLESYSIWNTGGHIGEWLYQKYGDFQQHIDAYNQQVIDDFNQEVAPETSLVQTIEQPVPSSGAQPTQTDSPEQRKFLLTSNDQIFFAGDSLMQGVAPHVQSFLQKQYDIKSVNLSKQSTGLSYPKFFDWVKTIKETLNDNKQIKVLVVFLGPNDPWDMPSPQGGTYLKFQSPEWEAVYRGRIADIIQTAKEHHVEVMWLGPPNMRKDSLNKQMIYLNQIIADEVQKQGATFIDTRELVGNHNDVYNELVEQSGTKVKTRSADGIHFSVAGQKILAEMIEKNLTVQ